MLGLVEPWLEDGCSQVMLDRPQPMVGFRRDLVLVGGGG